MKEKNEKPAHLIAEQSGEDKKIKGLVAKNKIRVLIIVSFIAACIVAILYLALWSGNDHNTMDIESSRSSNPSIQKLIEEEKWDKAMELVKIEIHKTDSIIKDLEDYLGYDPEIDYDYKMELQYKKELKQMKKTISKKRKNKETKGENN